MTLISSFASWIGVGGAPLMSIRLGQKNERAATQMVANCFALLTGMAVVIMTMTFLFRKPLLVFFGASPSIFPYANEYMSWYLSGTVFALLAAGMNQFIICQGFAKVGMKSVVLGAVCNIALDPVFIFVLDMGVKGAAIATVLSQAVSAAWNVNFLMGKKSFLRLSFCNIRPDFRIMGQICSLGISPFIMRATESLISIVLNRGLQMYGGDLYVGSLTIMQSVLQLFSAPLTGFTQGVQPIISYNYGAGKFDRVKKLYRSMIAVSFTISFVANMTAMCFPALYASLFTNDEELIGLVSRVMPIFLFGMLFFGLQNGIQPTFLALGQAKISLFIAMFRKVILLVPLALVLPRFFGVMGIYYAEPVSDIISAATACILFALNIKKILSKEYLARIH